MAGIRYKNRQSRIGCIACEGDSDANGTDNGKRDKHGR